MIDQLLKEDTAKKFKSGDTVKISGLKSAVHLNGSCGKLISWDWHEERWKVECYNGRNFCIKVKNLTLYNYQAVDVVVPDHPSVSEVLNDTDILSSILSYFDWRGILRARVCRKWREAARVTHVPETKTDDDYRTPELYLQNREYAEALGWISDALPLIPTVSILFNLRKSDEFKIVNGDNPESSLVLSSTFGDRPEPVDISPIANFRQLQKLDIESASMNGSYPFLFNFPNLRQLTLTDVGRLNWDLEVLVGLPKLERLRCIRNYKLTGSLADIRVLRENLLELCLSGCSEVEGNLMDLADFPRLKSLSLNSCDKVMGDIRDIGPGDFPSIEDTVSLPDTVYGGDLPSIAEAHDIMRAWHNIKKQNPKLEFYGVGLSLDSPERYHNDVHHSRDMPNFAELVQAGPRSGWRWTNCVSGGGCCEPQWFDAEPNPSDDNYDVYLKELKEVEKDVGFYKGFVTPPSQEEHLELNSRIPLDPMLQYLSNRNRSQFW